MARMVLWLGLLGLLAGAGVAMAQAPMEPFPARHVAGTEGGVSFALGGAAAAPADPVQVAGDGGTTDVVPRKVIYTGRFTVDAYDVDESQKALVAFVESRGGHLQQLSGRTVVVRIPSERFKEVEPFLRTLGRIDEALTDIRAQDITEEYYDIELRLSAKKKYLASLYELLNQAGELTEKLAVQQEIARVVEEIERLEGRLRLLASQVALATVTVTFRLAYAGSKRTFDLPWGWLDTLGVEHLVGRGGER